MSTAKYCHLYLTCDNTIEADTIAKALLNKRLIACSKQSNIDSQYWWEGKIDHANEVLLIMQSREDLFDAVEKEVAKLHSYDTFVLEMVSVLRVSAKASAWLHENLK